MAKTRIGGVPAYVGETKDQLRDGFGIYRYPNKFFRYEGEWKMGKKHGHGKLFMADGSYYEGQFSNGEINGTGIRKWSHNGNMYRGGFLNGELCGRGKMVYGDGSEYNGEWETNMRQGKGQLLHADGSRYTGEFYKNKRHGQGNQQYSNGELYEGDWINGCRQGHGVMQYKDGSIYSGQWQLDTRSGHGSVISASGASYEGQWINDNPELEACRLYIGKESYIEIERGSPFDIDVECRSAEDESCPDTGRLLQVTAGIRIGSQAKLQKLATDDPSADLTKISTPFGFDVYPHPVVEMKTIEEKTKGEMTTDSVGNVKMENATSNDDQSHERDKQMENPENSTEDASGNEVLTEEQQGENTNETLAADSEDKEPGSSFLLPHETTVEGKATFNSLVFPQRIMHRLSPENTDGRQTAARSRREDRQTAQGDMADRHSKTDAKGKKDKKDQKLAKEDKYSKPGDYIIIVKDVTDPPFLGVTLEPAFMHVKIVTQIKKTKSKTDGRS